MVSCTCVLSRPPRPRGHFLPRRRFERGNVDKFEVPPELQYTIVNMEETILDQCAGRARGGRGLFVDFGKKSRHRPRFPDRGKRHSPPFDIETPIWGDIEGFSFGLSQDV